VVHRARHPFPGIPPKVRNRYPQHTSLTSTLDGSNVDTPFQQDTYAKSRDAKRRVFDWVDESHMARALDLAWRAAGQTDPNPLVGAVVASGGEVVGEGFHHRCGDAHAEVGALDEAGERARGATMYVSLEPCSHHGRTPPCTDRIISAGVRRVVIPAVDPDDKVRGRGVDELRRAGVRVDVGCMDVAAVATNLGYYKERLGMGPSVILKMAVTLDGKIASAPGRRDDVTGEAARRYVHRMRASCDGVVVGIGTVRTDDPRLDCRLAACGSPPFPVVLDSRLSLPADNRWSSEGQPFVVIGARGAEEDKVASLEARGGRVLLCATDGTGRVDVTDALERLSEVGLRKLLVEGGAEVFSSFLRADAWDALFVFHAPKIYGGDGVSVFSGVHDVSPDVIASDAVPLEGDFLHRYLNRRTLEEMGARLRAGSRD
jgi:diaminohydroxyphosphoribosylaminopyrimidine deaminase/5-amino-6-(5-phosphoribosylamino)uracil reductase